MQHISRVTAAVAALALVTPVVESQPASAVEDDYGSRVTITRGEQAAAELPITLTLPAPADGTTITEVVAGWDEQVPQTGAASFGSTRFDATHCLPDVDCEVEGVLPTAGMLKSTPIVRFRILSGDTTVGVFSRVMGIDNPKPSVAMTSPENQSAVWDTFTVTADATPSTDQGAAPLKGVRFYLDTENRYSQQDGYLFDDTAPYSVSVPVEDLKAPVLGQPKIAVVAEDVHGRLSLYPESGAYPLMTRRVTVGPPPELSLTEIPAAPPETGGSVSGGVSIGYHTELPEAVPEPDGFLDPYIYKVERLIDGEVVSTYSPYGQPRSFDATPRFSASEGLSGGRHTFTVRVHTSYKSVAEISADVLVSDGVRLTGPITSGSRIVRNGFVVTAGDVLRFRAPVETKVEGTHLGWASMDIGNHSLLWRDFDCAADAGDCAASAVLLSGQWGAPDEPGGVTLEMAATADGDRHRTTFTREITVQPAARLVARVSRHRIRIGRAVRVTAVLRRADDGTPQAGRTVRIQWKPLHAGRWKTVARRTTSDDGRIAARFKPRRTGLYRLRSPEVRGTLGAGISNELKVRVRRR